MVEAVREGLRGLPPSCDATLLLSASGSMFDDWEVPDSARERIFELVRQVKTRAIVCESRAEFITDVGVRDFVAVFEDREVGIGLGLESADPWLLKFSINKALSLADYVSAVKILRGQGVASAANVIVGPPFLTAAEAIDDTIESVRWAFENGVDQCVLFPAHVKRHTLAEWLWRRGMYAAPSLWSLVRVLYRLGPQMMSDVTISWYKNYYAAAKSEADFGFASSPATCPRCLDSVVSLLDDFRGTGDFDVVEQLEHFACDCRTSWEESLQVVPELSRVRRAAEAYELLGRDLLPQGWWDVHGAAVLAEVDG
jgi:radical SAM enzyme (TIGR01210 family)